MMSHQTVTVLDFGDQYNQLIVRQVRECSVCCEVKPCTTPLEQLRAMEPVGFISAGSPDPVYEAGAPEADPVTFGLGVPVLGIHYGCQLITHTLGGQVTEAHEDTAWECGKTEAYYDTTCKFFGGLPKRGISQVNHGDYMAKVPEGFTLTAHSDACPNVAIADEKRGFYGVQYHPEVNHTEHDVDMIRNFLYEVCGIEGDWAMGDYEESSIKAIREKIGDDKALLALSSGVDSSMAAALLTEAVDSQFTYVLVDHGLMRKNEDDEVEAALFKWDTRFVRVDAEARFLEKLSGAIEPECRRKVIGEEFIRVSEEETKKTGQVDYLVQGTIYPDVIESGASDAVVIESRHSVGGLSNYVDFREIIEPLHPLFKGGVHQLGHELGLSEYLTVRQPLPGPGLTTRVIDDLAKGKLDTPRDVDAAYREEIIATGEDKSISQYLTVLTNTHSVGVMGDGRTCDHTLALRAVTTSDFMAAD